MAASPRTGVILVNVGTPASTSTSDVRAYLREFLSDPRVIDLPAPARWLLLNAVILPFRPAKSAEAYRQIWTERGSPLLVNTLDAATKLGDHLGPAFEVRPAMRYGEPSLARALSGLQASGVERVVVVPAFPQYASATTGSVLEETYRLASAGPVVTPLSVLPPFHARDEFLAPATALVRDARATFAADHVLFSFHGLPERQVERAYPAHCLKSDSCCDTLDARNQACYRAQSIHTARAMAARLGLDDGAWSYAFQSRLGRAKWIGPATDEAVRALAAKGMKRLLVACPSFVADCLETLEEIGIRAAEEFRHAGGEELRLVPAVNDSDAWIDGLARLVTACAQDSSTKT